MVCIHNGILATKSEILLFETTQMDLEGIMIREISQRKTNTGMASLTCGN